MNKKNLITILVFEGLFFASFVVRTVLNITHTFNDGAIKYMFGALLLLLVWVVPLFEKITKIKLYYLSVIVYLLGLTLSTLLGSAWGMYDKWQYYDLLTHCINSALIGLITYNILSASKTITMSSVWLFVAVFSITMTCGALWELWEFGVDRIFGLNCQRYIALNGTPLVGYKALLDTMTDMIADFVGAVVSSTIAVIFRVKHSKEQSSLTQEHSQDSQN